MTNVPDNEFSEQFTADMASEETMWHYWMQPKYDEARKEWEKKVKPLNRERETKDIPE